MRTALSPMVSILAILAIVLLITPSASLSLKELNDVEANEASTPNSLSISLASHSDVSVTFPSSSMMFIENIGQFGDDARFQIHGGDGTLWLAENALWVTLLKCPQVDRRQQQTPVPSGRFDMQNEDELCRGVNIKLSFVGSNPHPRLEPFKRLDTRISYFIGNDPARWRADVPVWGGVRYRELYPGIDLELTGENGHLVQRLMAHADAAWGAVRLRVEGADRLALDGSILRLTTAVGEYHLPLFQVAGAPAADVPAPALTGDQVRAPFVAPLLQPQSTRLAQNPPSPDLLYSTFLGGSSYDYGNAIAIDETGNTYVAGDTYSLDFPTALGAFDPSHNNIDAFVLKVSANGTTLLYATFLGGSFYDHGRSIAVDRTGNAYVTGATLSSDFPSTTGVFDTSYNGYWDAFVAQLNPTGSSLVYSTFLGGSLGHDEGWDIAIDGAGNAYVTGETESADFHIRRFRYQL